MRLVVSYAAAIAAIMMVALGAAAFWSPSEREGQWDNPLPKKEPFCIPDLRTDVSVIWRCKDGSVLDRQP